MTFAQRIIDWQQQHGRHHLPWQSQDPYHIWLSEIMLQQTQVATVIPYYHNFLAHFPNVRELADASQDAVLAQWAGLGYYARARNLHRAAQQIRDQYHGQFPQTRQALETLSGIGRSTAAAIAAFAYGAKEAILDGNVKRILARHQALDTAIDSSAGLKTLWSIAENQLPTHNIAAYTQGLMDLGSLICTRSKPKCQACPIASDCAAYQRNQTSEYPKKTTKKAKPEKHGHFLLASTAKQHILLEKRPEQSIWGGLWSLPWFDSLESLHNAYPNLNLDTPPLYHRHIFTHYILHLHIHCATLADDHQPSDQQQLTDAATRQQLGLPAPIALIINSHRTQQEKSQQQAG